jgi:hypothetical protein
MRVLTDFRKRLGLELGARAISIDVWPKGRSPNLLELATSPKATVLYVKEFNVPKHAGFWGLTRNQIDRLQAAQIRWFAVLLMRSSVDGYLISGQQVIHRVNSGHFELSGDGDYKVNELTDLVEAQKVRGIQDLVDRIL